MVGLPAPQKSISGKLLVVTIQCGARSFSLFITDERSTLRLYYTNEYIYSDVFHLTTQTKRKLAFSREMLLLILLQFIKQSLKLYRIKVVLVEKDMSQTQLAQLLGKSFSSVNAYCSNRTQPLLDVLKQIADILSVNVRDLIIDE